MAWTDIVATRAPRPSLLGMEIEGFPYASGFSMLLRVSRLMHLEPGEWPQTLGVGYPTGVLPDLREGRVARARLEAALGLAGTSVPAWWAEELWSPLQTGGLLDATPRPIRWCWHCAGFGYHCSLFQLPSIHRCPWHDFPLLDRCPKCEQAGKGWIDDEGRLGRCPCGHDWLRVDEATIGMRSFPTDSAEAWLSKYLGWAAQERSRRALVAPANSDRWLEGYAVLAQPPEEFAQASGRSWGNGTRDQEFKDGPQADPPVGHFWGWSALGADRPLTYVPLPALTLSALAQVTQRVIAALPSDLPTPMEMASFSDLEEGVCLRDNAASRPECFIAPHGRTADGSTWLDVSAVDLPTLQLCGQLIDAVVQGCDPDPEQALDYSRQVARAAAISRVAGRWRLNEALDAILSAGYAQGLEALLRNMLPLPPPADWRFPVAEIEGTRGHLARVRVCWVPTPPPRLSRPSWMAAKPVPPKKTVPQRPGRCPGSRRKRSEGRQQAR